MVYHQRQEYSAQLLLFLFGIIAGLIIWREVRAKAMMKRNFEISQKGTYGTAGFMGEEERSQVLRTDKNLEKVDGVIFGRDIQDKNNKSSGRVQT